MLVYASPRAAASRQLLQPCIYRRLATTPPSASTTSSSTTNKASIQGLIRPRDYKYTQRSRSGARAERSHVLKRLVAVAAVIGGLTIIEKLWWRDVQQPQMQQLGTSSSATAPTAALQSKSEELLSTTAVGKLCEQLPTFRTIRVRESQLLPSNGSQRATLEVSAARDPGVNDPGKVADRARLYMPTSASMSQLYTLLVEGVRSDIEQQTGQRMEDVTSSSQYMRDVSVLLEMSSNQRAVTFPTPTPVLEVLRNGDGRLVIGLGDLMLHYGQSKLVSDAVMQMFARDVAR